MRNLILDAAALKYNFSQVKHFAPRAKVLSMVKANAYGHGLGWVAEHLVNAGTEGLGIAVLEEAAELRATGFDRAAIFLMDGFTSISELKEALRLNLTLVLFDLSHLALLDEAKMTQPVDIWLKVDTGMHRLGFMPTLLPDIYAQVKKISGIHRLGLMTHFSESDDLRSAKTLKQINAFEAIHAAYPKAPTSLSNSAAVMAWPQAHGDWIRPGLMLYGVSPFGQQDHRLKPVMTAQAKIIFIQDLPAGAQVGYGGTYTCTCPTRAATVAFGYGDGYPRSAVMSEVLVRGKFCKVIGRISMDNLLIDITHTPEIVVGDEATLWGKKNPLENLANAANTIPYEILCKTQHHRLNIIYC